MPPDIDGSAAGRTLGAMAERVAIVETRVSGLKDDTQVIRASIHNINNDMMAIRATETRCADALEALQAILTLRAAQVDKIASNVDALLVAKGAAEGAWWATARIASVIVALLAALAMLTAGAAWVIDNLRLR